MTLLNALLALGAFAFTVPLAIHLLFRSRFVTLDWGAMHLLESVVRINRRRLQLTNLLLLLLRCLIPVLLAFCLARPVLTGFRALPGDAPRSIVLVVDDSRSMAAVDESGKTRLERLQQDLGELVGGLSRRDEVILIRSSRVETPASSMGPQDGLRKIAELEAHCGPLDLDQLVRAGWEACRSASHPQRHLLIVSDFQSINSGDAALQSLTRLSETIEQQPNPPRIRFLNYGVDTERLSNVSVDSLAIDSAAVVAGRGARFSARIRNASDRTVQDLRVVWSIDGSALPPRTVSISPRSTTTQRLTHRIEEPGVHQVTLSIEHADALGQDNRRSIGVDVVPEIRVLLVDGKPSSRPLEGETDFLAIALSPFAFGGEDLPDAVRTSVIDARKLDSELIEHDVLVLADVPRLGDQLTSRLAQYVMEGGCLVVFDGDHLDVDWYNSTWTCPAGSFTLPARLGDLVGQTDSSQADPLPVGELNLQYTPWKLLQSEDEKPLSRVDIFGYRKLTLIPPKRAGEDAAGPAMTLLSMANGDALVVSAQRGQGQVVQFGLPCDTGWSTLPLREAYLPMVQQLVLDLAGRSKRVSATVGQRLTVSTTEFGELPAGKEPVSSSYSVQNPRAAEFSLEVDAQHPSQLSFADTHLPGLYRFRQTLSWEEGEPQTAGTIRVVEVDGAESKLRDTDPKRLAAAADRLGATIYRDIQSLQADDHTSRFGREIWRRLLIAVLVCMVAELLLQQHTMRAGRARGGVT
ncbi:MAG: BatA domain-containing protein [Pirellulales bacterium]|nr:BatA domain-containing protein [Pirellulales bacterium]